MPGPPFVVTQNKPGPEPGHVQAHYRDYSQMTYARSVLVIHNMAHQGRGPMADLNYLEVCRHVTCRMQ